LLAIDVPAGFQDPSFNGFGLQTTHVVRDVSVAASALQADGKIVVAGTVTEFDGTETVGLVRYMTNGHLDLSFGGPTQPGVVELAPGSMIDQVHAVAIDQNHGSFNEGDIVIAGSWTDPAQQQELALARFQSDGSLDSSFGTGGIVVDPREPNATGLALAIQSDDRVVVLGASNWPSSSAISFLERFNPDGTPDPGFGSGGQPVLPFGSVPLALNGGLALDASGHIVVAGIEDASSSSSAIVVAMLTSDGQPVLSFGSAGIATTTVQGDHVPINVQGLALNQSGRILVAGTADFYANSASPGSPAFSDFWVARYDLSGDLDPTFNGGSLKFVDFQQNGLIQFSADSAIALAPDGKVVLAGNTSSASGVNEQEDIALAQLNADGTLDESFGEGGLDVDSLGYGSSIVNAILPSLLVQPDGNIVAAFTYEVPNAALTDSDFGVARFLGQVGSFGSGTIAAGVYRETFVSAGNPTEPTLDNSDVFQHNLWYNSQPSLDRLDVAKGNGWDLERHPAGGSFALHEEESYAVPATLDAITFPNLRPDVRVGLASVDVAAVAEAFVTFVGTNGSYTVVVPSGTTQIAAAGEAHVLTGDSLNPSLELGPIREVILDSQNAFFSNVKILVIPGQGPLDDFVTASATTPTSIDVLTHAEAEAPAAGLQLPLQLVGQPGQPSLPGASTATSATNPGEIVYSPGNGQGKHPADSFTYTVQDFAGTMATGTVYVTIDTPPQFASITTHFPAVYDAGRGGWNVPHGTNGPLTGVITLQDADQDPVTLTILSPADSGTVTLTKISGYQYSYRYDPPTIDAYESTRTEPTAHGPVVVAGTGQTTPVSAIVGVDQFTLEASDGLAVTDYTVQFIVQDRPPTTPMIDIYPSSTAHAPIGFIVPKNTGVSYYRPQDINSISTLHYDPLLDKPGLVHFAAPGVLWSVVDPDGDPLMAVLDSSNLPKDGSVQLYPDGSFNFVPKRGFVGGDSFGFYASDGYKRSILLYCAIDVVPGTSAKPFQQAPVLLDVHYNLYLLANGGAGELVPSITAYDHHGDFGKIDSALYPTVFLLIRPARSALNNSSQDIEFDDLTKLENLGTSKFDNLSLSHKDDALVSLDVFLNASGHAPDNSSDGALSFSQSDLTKPIDVSLTYAAISPHGWLSNFAAVDLHIVPPVNRGSHHVRHHHQSVGRGMAARDVLERGAIRPLPPLVHAEGPQGPLHDLLRRDRLGRPFV